MNDTGARVKLVLDEALLAHETLNFHPPRRDMTTAISREDFLGFAAASGHTVTRIELHGNWAAPNPAKAWALRFREAEPI